jgi:hypothetical protein
VPSETKLTSIAAVVVCVTAIATAPNDTGLMLCNPLEEDDLRDE